MSDQPNVRKVTPVGSGHAVATISGLWRSYRRKPCEECPWRKDRPTGIFPALAFKVSANTAHDASFHQFACHMSGMGKAATCAGFLLKNAANNVGARIAIARGDIDMRQVSSDVPLYSSYRAMAVANGVPRNDPALKRCRANDKRGRDESV